MTTLLFPSIPSTCTKSGPQKRLAYAVILTDVVRGCSDAIDALSLFDDLLHGRTTGPDSLGFMAFNAHGGDTGCQLRAGMIQDLWVSQRGICTDPYNGTVQTPAWLTGNVERLRQLRERCFDVCAQLTKKRVKPEKLGLGEQQDTPAHLLEALGWSERYETSPYTLEFLLSHNKDEVGDASSDHASSDAEQQSSTFSIPASQVSSSSTSIPPKDEDRDTAWQLQTKWNMMEPASVIRLVVYAFVLSKYKKFCRLDTIVGARLEPASAARYGSQIMMPYLNPTNRDYKPGKIPRIGLEFRVMQEWLSDHSCAWIKTLCERSSHAIDLSQFIGRTVQRSAKSITATACYPAYLLQREHWAEVGSSMIFIDRYFCSQGWHFNCFEAKLQMPMDTLVVHPGATTASIPWKVTRIGIDQLIQSKDKAAPHVILMGNSIAGSYAQYMDRVPKAEGDHTPGSRTHSGVCVENELHVEKFGRADLDRVLLGFFAAHKAYSFPLTSGEEEMDFLDRCFDEFGHDDDITRVKEGWTRNREDADELGAGRGSLHVFGLQHMFTETLPRVGARVKIWQECEGLLLLSAGCVCE